MLVFGQLQNTLYAQSDYKLAEQDSLALVAFYNATNGSNWISNQEGFGFDDLSSEFQDGYYTVNDGFNNWFDGPVKDWFGVTLELLPIPNSSDSIYRVVKLWPVLGRRTDGQNLVKGYIPKEVGLLTALKEFWINGNDFSGTEIPDDLYHSTLEYLDIESAYIEGDISDALRNCTNLLKTNFRYNNIDYIPVFDFLDEEQLNKITGTQWWYSTQIPYSIIEKTIDYFYTVSPNPKEFGLECRDLFDVGDEQEVVAALGSAVELECIYAGEHEDRITYQWYKDGFSLFGKKSRILTISEVKESNYADYTVKITNEYVNEYDQNSNYGDVYTKAIHLVAEPVSPVIEWAKTSYNGKEIEIRFSKAMDESASGFEGFAISSGNRSLSATGARVEGRTKKDFIITLNEPIVPEEVISFNYSGISLLDENGGVLEDINGVEIENLVKQAPKILSAITTKDGSGIIVYFDNYIDQNSINPDNFKLNRDGDSGIFMASLAKGKIDDHISKAVLLTLNQPITNNVDVIKLEYTAGDLSGLYGGVVNTSDEIDVENVVLIDLSDVLITFEDGSKYYENIVVNTSHSINAIQMYDDGSHGDANPNDHNWAATLSLVDDTYSWDVLSRNITVSYDTTSVVDPETGAITMVLTPVELYKDELLSNDVFLEFEVLNGDAIGITSFSISNVTVVFNITIDYLSDELFLMGIEDDWGLGILLPMVNDTYKYSTSISGYSIGDIIEYNYRDGDNWENVSAQSRTYVVKSGENVINDVFGIFTSVQNKNVQQSIWFYPNPVQDKLNIEGVESYNKLDIISVDGRRLESISLNDNATYQLSVAKYQSGIYLLRLYSSNKKTASLRFIKN